MDATHTIKRNGKVIGYIGSRGGFFFFSPIKCEDFIGEDDDKNNEYNK